MGYRRGGLTVEPICAWQQEVVAKILTQGAERREGEDTESSLAFSIEIDGKRRGFLIPRPMFGGGYSLPHLQQIEEQLAWLELELLPLERH